MPGCGCCARFPFCVTFCNIANVGYVADQNRAKICRLKQVFLVIALILGIVGCFGLSSSESIIKDTYWIKYEADVPQVRTSTLPPVGSLPCSNLEIYGNVWGIMFYCDGKLAKLGNITEPLSWSDASDRSDFRDFNQDCKDSATSFKLIVVLIGVVSNFLNALGAMGRADRKKDYYMKCMAMLGSILPVVCNLALVTAFPNECKTSQSGVTWTLGPGYLCFLFSFIIGNIPVLILDFILPAPPPAEIEGDLELKPSEPAV